MTPNPTSLRVSSSPAWKATKGAQGVAVEQRTELRGWNQGAKQILSTAWGEGAKTGQVRKSWDTLPGEHGNKAPGTSVTVLTQDPEGILGKLPLFLKNGPRAPGTDSVVSQG